MAGGGGGDLPFTLVPYLLLPPLPPPSPASLRFLTQFEPRRRVVVGILKQQPLLDRDRQRGSTAAITGNRVARYASRPGYIC